MGYGKSLVRAALRTVTAVGALGAAAATAAPASPAATSDAESAVWTPHELIFTYKAFTTKYNCDSLRIKMKDVLLKLGARPDIQVRSFGCTRLTGPDQLPGVSIKMHVLQPAGTQAAQSVPASWKPVDLLQNRDPTDAAGDCELMSQIAREVLPLFATRNVKANTTCVPRTLIIGTTELKADVLTADSSDAHNAAR